MSTHDYVIDNQSAPSFRTDLNLALQAIVTQNSNATAPSVTYADMIWYDTANNQIKKRNEANTGWITLGTIDEGAGTFTPSGERAFATQAEAEAGTNTTTVMNPLRTAQAIEALTGVTLLRTLTTTSGTTQTASGLTLTPYAGLFVVIDGVSNDAGAGRNLLFGTAQLNLSSGVSGTGSLSGFAVVPLPSGIAATLTASAGTTPSALRFESTGYNSSTTSVSFTWSGAGNFDAGTISIYGLKK